MRILIVTDAWEPQVNGVVRTLKSTRRELERVGHEVELLTPLEFRTVPCPTYPDIRRVAVEKNLEAFLRLSLPGSKWVAGDGPALAKLRAEYPEVRFTGVLDQRQLAALYNAADVFVFPSRTDSFGLVLLEAMACGCPVAAFPVTGPVDVIGDSPAGALDEDLRQAAMRALKIPRAVARRHAEKFSWEASTRQFLHHLHPFNVGPGEFAFAPERRRPGREQAAS